MSGVVGEGAFLLNVQQGAEDKLEEKESLSLEEQTEQLQKIKDAQAVFREQRSFPNTRERRARTTETKTLSEFYELFQKIIISAQEIDGKNYSLRITKEYPPIDAKVPSLSISLLSRKPWEQGGREEYAPRLMESLPDPQFPGDMIEIYQRRQINEIRITCWARTSKVADDIADWVEDKFFEYLWALQWGGTSHPLFWLGRDKDIYREERRQQLYGAPIRFHVVTSKLSYKRISILRKLSYLFGLASEL